MADTLSGNILSVHATAQNADLNAAAFAALTPWVVVGHVGNVGETGSNTNLVNYDELGTSVTQKAKGITDAGNMTIEVAHDYGDAGQIIMKTISASSDTDNYAFKLERQDNTGGTTNTIEYFRGLVTGPTHPNGGVEDFVLDVYTVGQNQEETIVDGTG